MPASFTIQSRMKHARIFSVVLTAMATAHTAHAQLPAASAAGFSMAGNYTALARSYDAIAFNPAGLAQLRRTEIALVGFTETLTSSVARQGNPTATGQQRKPIIQSLCNLLQR